MLATPSDIEVRDATIRDLYIEGGLKADGTLTFKIQAFDLDTGQRGSVRGQTPFDLMMQHFGDGVLAIRGLWMEGTNLEGFNRATAAGMTLSDAARQTWTGRQAVRHGFSTVVHGKMIGSAGYYGWVEMTFFRSP